MKGESTKMKCLTLFLLLCASVSSIAADVKDDDDHLVAPTENRHDKRSVELIGPLLNSLSSSMGGSNDYIGSMGGNGGLLGLVGNLMNNAMGVTFSREGINMNLKTPPSTNNQESRSGNSGGSTGLNPGGVGLNFDLTKIGSNLINGYRVGKAAGSAGGGFLSTILNGVNGVADSLSLGSVTDNNFNRLPPPPRVHPPPQNNHPPPQNNHPPPQDNHPPPQNNHPPPQDNHPPPQDNHPPPQNNHPPPPPFDGPHPPQQSNLPPHPPPPPFDGPHPPQPNNLPPHPSQPNNLHPHPPHPINPLPPQHGPYPPPSPLQGPFLPPPSPQQLPNHENHPMPHQIQHENTDNYRGPPRDIVHEHPNRPLDHDNFREEGRHMSSEKPNGHHESSSSSDTSTTEEPDKKSTRRPNKNKGSKDNHREDNQSSSSSASRTNSNEKPNGRIIEEGPRNKNMNNNNNLKHPGVQYVDLLPVPQPAFLADNGPIVENIQVPLNVQLVDRKPDFIVAQGMPPPDAVRNGRSHPLAGYEPSGEFNDFRQLVPGVFRDGFFVVPPDGPIYDGRPNGDVRAIYSGNEADRHSDAMERGRGQQPISSYLPH